MKTGRYINIKACKGHYRRGIDVNIVKNVDCNGEENGNVESLSFISKNFTCHFSNSNFICNFTLVE